MHQTVKFICIGIFLIILSGIDNLIFIQRVLFANTILTIPLLGLGIFHHVYLTGPPPPVFILLTLSGLFSLYGWKKGLWSNESSYVLLPYGTVILNVPYIFGTTPPTYSQLLMQWITYPLVFHFNVYFWPKYTFIVLF